MSKRIYLDSCIIIYLIEGSHALRMDLRKKLEGGWGMGDEFRISDLTRLEARVAPIRRKDRTALRFYDDFFARRLLVGIPPTSEVFDRATHLRAESRLKTPDALHLAFAMEGGCGEFWTNDLHLQKAAGDRIRMVIPVEVG